MGVLSVAQLVEFKQTSIHKEIKDTLLMRLSTVRDDLENPNLSREDDLRNKGRAEELRFAADIIDLLIEEIKEDIEQEKEVSEDGD